MIMLDSFSFFFILPTKLFIMSYFKTFPFLKTTKRRGLIFDSNQHFSCSKSTSTDFCSHFQFSEKFSNFVVVLFTKQILSKFEKRVPTRALNARPYFSVCFVFNVFNQNKVCEKIKKLEESLFFQNPAKKLVKTLF